MSLTRADLISRAQRLTAARAFTLFSSTDLNDAFNEVMREWARRTECLSGEVSLDVVGYVATTLNQAGVTSGSPTNGGTLTLASVTGLYVPGGFTGWPIQIDNELVFYTGVNVGASQITGITRGYRGTTAAAHANGSTAVVSGQVIELAAGPNPVAPSAYKVRRVRYCPSGPLGSAWDLDEMAFEALPTNYHLNPSRPFRWAARGTEQLYLWPPPSATVANGLRVDTYNHPADLATDASADATVLPFPEAHRDGLVAGLCREICLMAIEDETLGARLPYFEGVWEREIARVADTEGNPSSKPIVFGGDALGDGLSRDPYATMLPSNYGTKGRRY